MHACMWMHAEVCEAHNNIFTPRAEHRLYICVPRYIVLAAGVLPQHATSLDRVRQQS